jgi:squamous cell carcinoma antigen recognized by T-cells 3
MTTIDNDDTFQRFSSFTTAYKPATEYESTLLATSKLRGGALKVYARREKDETIIVRSLVIL